MHKYVLKLVRVLGCTCVYTRTLGKHTRPISVSPPPAECSTEFFLEEKKKLYQKGKGFVSGEQPCLVIESRSGQVRRETRLASWRWSRLLEKGGGVPWKMYRVARKEEKFGETFRGRASTRHRSKFPNPFLSPFSNRANCTRRDLKPVSRYPCQFSIVARRCTFSYLSVFRLSLSLSIFDFPLSVHSFAVFILPSKMRIEWRRGGRGEYR